MRQTATQKDTTSELSVKQEKALDLLFTGQTATATALLVDVHRSTVHRWLNEPDFIAALNQKRVDAREAQSARLGHILDAALEAVASAVEQGDAQVALSVLKGVGVLSGSSLPIGPTDPALVRDRQREQKRDAQILAALTM
jgi:hypothetical protein